MTEGHVEDAARKRPLVYDKGGDAHYDFASAFIKSMRGSDPDGSSTTSLQCSREADLGSSPAGWSSLPRTSAWRTRRRSSSPSLRRRQSSTWAFPRRNSSLAEAAIYLALAPKSNDVIVALRDAQKDVRDHGHLRPPDALRDTSYYGARKLGRTGLRLPPLRTPEASRSTTCPTS